ncbi:carbonic anhydrase [Brackiella oedipodis]|uniref:carbonic anhydrase n=1 Tax=Brackiella oedipodis TaxID=124225 RepID=UPI00048F8256|nr:carbonic anhydrase [Brackiella oedipodis]
MFPKRLKAGYQEFLHGRLEEQKKVYKKLGELGQNPDIMVIACGDSRVAPETIFNANPGEIFTVRNIANIVPPCESASIETSYHGTSAAIEFAVEALKVKHIVIMGHASCGGVAAFANNAAPLTKRNFIGKWMSQIEPIKEKVGPQGEDKAAWIQKMEWAVVEYSMNNLLTFPNVKARVDAGELQIHGAYFGIATGVLFVRNERTGQFEPFQE